MEERTFRFADLDDDTIAGLNRVKDKLAITVKDFKVAKIKRVFKENGKTLMTADFWNDTVHLCKEGTSFGLATDVDGSRMVDTYKEI